MVDQIVTMSCPYHESQKPKVNKKQLVLNKSKNNNYNYIIIISL